MPEDKDLTISLTLGRLKKLIQMVNMSPVLIIVSSVLAVLSSVFEFLAIILLLPVVKAIISGNFSFLRDTYIFQQIASMVGNNIDLSGLKIFIVAISAILFASLAKCILQYMSGAVLTYHIYKFLNTVRKAIFERYLSFGKLFFDRENAGHLLHINLGQTQVVCNGLKSACQIIPLFFLSLVYIIIMFKLSVKLTLASFLLFPILNSFLKGLIARINRTTKPLSQAGSTLLGEASNILTSMPLVKAYNSERYERDKFWEASTRYSQWMFSMDKKTLLMSPIREMITLFMMLVLLLITGLVIVKGDPMRVGSFLVFFLVLRRASDGFSIINSVKTTLAQIGTAVYEISIVFDDKDKCFVEGGRRDFKGLNQEIKFDNLTFSYKDREPALKDVSFTIKKGHMVAIVGPTGAGKTTVINLLIRFYDCQPSRIYLDGVDIRDFTLKSLRGGMALVSQDVYLFNETLRYNVTYGIGRTVEDEEIKHMLKQARLHDFIKTLPDGLNTMIGERGIKLSGGEKQRISIARALLRNADILLLDEATSALDTKTERLIQEAIEEASKGRTIVAVAHRLSTIKNADKVVVINDGRLIEKGPLDALLEKKGKFYEYWQDQKFY